MQISGHYQRQNANHDANGGDVGAKHLRFLCADWQRPVAAAWLALRQEPPRQLSFVAHRGTHNPLWRRRKSANVPAIFAWNQRINSGSRLRRIYPPQATAGELPTGRLIVANAHMRYILT
jgi:hypothetical protein